MKIQFLNGGLANQTFQYIFARYYELSHPGQQMYMDDSYFAVDTVHNGYELEKVFPNARPHMLSQCFDTDIWEYILSEKRNGKSIPQILSENGLPIMLLSEYGDSYKNFNPFEGKVGYIKANSFAPGILDLPDENVYYHGYWLIKDWLYSFKDILLQELFIPPVTELHNQKYMRQIQKTFSTAVHIRRGDFVTLGWSLSTDRIKEKIEHFLDNTPKEIEFHAFVFSDDIPWCEENFDALGLNKFHDCTFVKGNSAGKNYRDLQLMSSCKSMIMSNSSFCYLAALLNQTKQYCLVSDEERQI